jgi:hypothetical protein
LTAQRHTYRGYRIVVDRYDGGWHAVVHAPVGVYPILGPQSDDPASHKVVMETAQRLIDALTMKVRTSGAD